MGEVIFSSSKEMLKRGEDGHDREWAQPNGCAPFRADQEKG